MRAWWGAAWVVVVLAGCHLGDTLDPPRCEEGSHALNGHCVVDETVPTITIASCAPTPASFTTKTTGTFAFKNDDTVDHTITGSDGQTWTSVAAGQTSMFFGITKVGSWTYAISGCSTPGVVVVE